MMSFTPNAPMKKMSKKALDYLKRLKDEGAQNKLKRQDLSVMTAETPPYFYNPFAVGGDVSTVPVTTQPDGSVSYEEGYGPDYELNLLTDPDALPIGRQTFNQVLFDVTTLLQWYSQNGTPPFITTSQNQGTPFSYPQYARTYYDGDVYLNQLASNTATPGTDNSWIKVSNPTSALYNYFAGFLSSDDGTSMTFGAGSCSDSTNSVTIVNSASSFSKNYTTAWAAGSGNGGVPTGVTLLENTYYYDFVIMKADGTVDFGLDTDINATNLLADATDFIYFRRVRAHFTQTASTNIETMNQCGREFQYAIYRQDISFDATEAEFNSALPVSLPLIPVVGIFSAVCNVKNDGSSAQLDIYCSANVPKGTNQPRVLEFSGNTAAPDAFNVVVGVGEHRVISYDTNLGVNFWLNSNENGTVIIQTMGWIDNLD